MVISALVNKRWKSKSWPCSDPAAPDLAAEAAARADSRGHNVYCRVNPLNRQLRHAGERGAAADTAAVTALVADVDVAGPGHHHGGELPLPGDLDQARAMLRSLPAPSMEIATGGGMHLWWLLAEPEDDFGVVDRWADGIVALAAEAGYHLDRPDLARVLRVAGTHRRKPGVAPNLVSIADVGGGHGWPEAGLTGGRPWRPTVTYTASELIERLPEPAPPPEPPRPPWRRSQGGEYGPAAAVAEGLSWGEILAPCDWTYAGRTTIDGTYWELWKRPGATSPYSLKANPEGPAICWSDQAGLPSGAGQRLNKWRVYAALYHGGDQRAAACHIRRLAREVARV